MTAARRQPRSAWRWAVALVLLALVAWAIGRRVEDRPVAPEIGVADELPQRVSARPQPWLEVGPGKDEAMASVPGHGIGRAGGARWAAT